jgi:hypothetical protein
MVILKFAIFFSFVAQSGAASVKLENDYWAEDYEKQSKNQD